jgi:hypothetical protein
MFDEILSAYGNKLTIAVLGVGLALVLLLAVLWLIRGRGGPSPFVRGGKSRQPRLQVLDAAAVDARRRLVLVRRDNVEHLIMIGGPTDIVIESGIGDDRLAALEGTIARDRAAIAAAEADARISAERSAAMIAPARAETVRTSEPERPAAASRPAPPVRQAEPVQAVAATARTEASEPVARAEPRPIPTPPPVAVRPQAPEPAFAAVAPPAAPTTPTVRPYQQPAPVVEAVAVPPAERPVVQAPQPVSPAPAAVIAAAAPVAPAAQAQPTTETRPLEAYQVEAGNMLDAVRQRVMPQPPQRQSPAPATPDEGVELPDFVPRLATPATAPGTIPRPVAAAGGGSAAPAVPPKTPVQGKPKELGSEFERILETEMARNLQSGELPDDLMERLTPQPPAQRREPGATPAQGTSADPAMQNEIARIFGEMSVTRDK